MDPSDLPPGEPATGVPRCERCGLPRGSGTTCAWCDHDHADVDDAHAVAHERHRLLTSAPPLARGPGRYESESTEPGELSTPMPFPPSLSRRYKPSIDARGQGPAERDDIPVDPDASAGTAPTWTRRWAHDRFDVLAAVGAGGAVGNLARYEISRAFPVGAGRFPTSTFAINTSGSFVLGIVLVLLIERLPPSRYARAFLAVGAIGAYTTFSTFAVEAVQLVSDHHLLTAVSFVIASIGAGLAAARIGIGAGRAVPHRHPPAPRHPGEEST